MVVSPSPILLGPPCLRSPSTTTPSNPTKPQKGLTENSSPTFLSTGNPCLDFFFHIVPGTPSESIVEQLQLAYAYNPLTTLKLICHLRGVRGTGKCDKKGFYTAALWLHDHHPKTLACNVRSFGEFGYLKDLPEILYRVLEGNDFRKKARAERAGCTVSWKGGKRTEQRAVSSFAWRKGKRVAVTKRAKFVIGNRPAKPKPRIKKPKSSFLQTKKPMPKSKKAAAVPTPCLPKKPTLHDFILQQMMNGNGAKKKRKGKGAQLSSQPTLPERWPCIDISAKIEKEEEEIEDKIEKEEEEVEKKEEVEEKMEKEEEDVEEKKEKKKKERKQKKEKEEEEEEDDVIYLLTPRKKKAMIMAKKAISRYVEDLKYRFLHDCISNLFAQLLSQDLKLLESGDISKISLASKWCPSLNSSYDRATLICESIAKRIFPHDFDPKYEGIEEAHYAYRVRDRLRKQVLVPLRKTLELPELYMSSGDWGVLPYARVPSVAMKTYKSFFRIHDRDRFSEFLEKVEKGEAKLAAGALLPHEIIASISYDAEQSRVGELQWKRMVEDLSKQGKLNSCIAICDVSGSMNGMPMEVCVALGLLLSELSEDPWKGKLITFSAKPQLHKIEGNTLYKKMRFVKAMDWGMNTDFQKVFDKILEVAVSGNLSSDQMIKRVFVFSDMEFDQASANSWETDYEAIQRKYKENGYGSVVPEIIFWNLRDSRATPVTATQNGVALVSGYSKNLMKLFLKGDGVINPEIIMEKAISGKQYQNLVVFD